MFVYKALQFGSLGKEKGEVRGPQRVSKQVKKERRVENNEMSDTIKR